MPSAATGSLAGCTIVITRPAHQAGSLADKVRTAGGSPLLFPVIEIGEARDLGSFHARVDRLDEFDMAIFISPNAVNRALDLIATRRAFPHALSVAAVGDATVRALERRGIHAVIAPVHTFDSEALLALPELQAVSGKRIVIFRGEGGREALGAMLCERGAQVEYAECYRRVVPQRDPAPLIEAWARGELHAVVVTSSEGLANLFAMLGEEGTRHLVATPVFVPHPRIAENARRRGATSVITTAAGDQAIFEGLVAYFSSRR